ncbi:hypothetical protein [Actinomyces succiniciruminis]|uniref:Conserved domain protein n=1 Tax=Actinomyces succiniciruminis TaxID=1522002 RepID=A0A1L7RQC8_9ACTO|nr:hypothetical protein [Actinomyces succiniciruminis]CED91748.1 Conserved domain protein [Actinomyces succiniciruminis]
MRKSRAVISPILVLVLCVALPTPTAAAVDGDSTRPDTTVSVGGTQSSDGGASLEASVTVTYTMASGGAVDVPTTTTSQVTSVAPSCGYKPGRTGAEAAEFIGGFGDEKANRAVAAMYPGWEDYVDDTTGRWWTRYCDESAFADQDAYVEAAREFNAEHPWHVWVAEGEDPPDSEVDPAALASAVWTSVSAAIPSPSIDRNPTIGESRATVVGFDTWVWATADTPTRVEIVAAVGSTSVTVIATSSGLDLSAQDAEADCTGFGIPWTPANDAKGTDCVIVFDRSSAHLGGTTPMNVDVQYSASWRSTTDRSGYLGALTTTSTVEIPVAEIQALNTNTRQP